jgi:hypothetical protein
MADELIVQPSAQPTRKVTAAGIAGALAVAVIAGLNFLWPGEGDTYAAIINTAFGAVAAVLAGYMARERA